jgi:hypothetical protein
LHSAAATEIQITFGPIDSLDYLLYDAYSDPITASETFSITNRLPYAYATVTAPNIADFCIPDIQRWAFEMYLFESADLEMNPSDIEIKLHILLQFNDF